MFWWCHECLPSFFALLSNLIMPRKKNWFTKDKKNKRNPNIRQRMWKISNLFLPPVVELFTKRFSRYVLPSNQTHKTDTHVTKRSKNKWKKNQRWNVYVAQCLVACVCLSCKMIYMTSLRLLLSFNRHPNRTFRVIPFILFSTWNHYCWSFAV